MDLDERVRQVGRELGPERWLVTLGAVAPGSPRLLAETILEIGRVGGELSCECAADPSPRAASWWSALEDELDEYLDMPNDPATLRLVAHVVKALPAHAGRAGLVRRLDGRWHPEASDELAAA